MTTLLDIVRCANDVFPVKEVEQRFPWLFQREQDCIVSPDCDGLLCGLLMSHMLGWRVRGFYDGKVMVCDHRVQPRRCVFLDTELLRPGVRSVGQHMLIYNRNQMPAALSALSDCFAINSIRGFDTLHEYRRKYPFGTIHLLLVTLHNTLSLRVPSSASGPLLFADGTYHNLFRYTENCSDWLRYLGCDDKGNPLSQLVDSSRSTVLRLMTRMMEFWQIRNGLSVRGQRGDRVAITARGGRGDVINLVLMRKHHRFADDARVRGESLLRLLGDRTEWAYDPKKWCWHGWAVTRLRKQRMDGVNGRKFSRLMVRSPLSLALTGNKRCEFTLEAPDQAFGG